MKPGGAGEFGLRDALQGRVERQRYVAARLELSLELTFQTLQTIRPVGLFSAAETDQLRCQRPLRVASEARVPFGQDGSVGGENRAARRRFGKQVGPVRGARAGTDKAAERQQQRNAQAEREKRPLAEL